MLTLALLSWYCGAEAIFAGAAPDGGEGTALPVRRMFLKASTSICRRAGRASPLSLASVSSLDLSNPNDASVVAKVLAKGL